MSDRHCLGVNLPIADYFFDESEAAPAYDYRLFLFALASSLLVHCVLIAVHYSQEHQASSKRTINVDISLAPAKHPTQAITENSASAERSTTLSTPNPETKSETTTSTADAIPRPQSDPTIVPKARSNASPQTTQPESEYSASRNGGTVFDPKLRQELENRRSQPSIDTRSPTIQTFQNIHGSKVLRVGDNCMQYIAGVDSMDPGQWTLPSKCVGVKSASENMADRLRQALRR